MKKIIKICIISFLLTLVSVALIFTHNGYELYQDSINVIGIIEKIDQIRNSDDYINLDRISEDFIESIIAVEDHRFYLHEGIDYISVSRAVITNIKAKKFVSGGSTITQQLAKNLYLSSDKKIERKVAEAFIAKDLEAIYEKDEIIEIYVNIIYFGDGFTGIRNATEGYFNCSPDELSKAQSVILAGLPQSPSRYALTENFERAVKRSESVLKALISQNLLSCKDGILLEYQIKILRR